MKELIPDSWWDSGYCSIFAMALKQLCGGAIFAIVDHSRRFNDDCLHHCYVVIGDVAYDSMGGCPVEKASDTTSNVVLEMDKDNDVVFLWKEVDEPWFEKVHGDYDPGKIPQAIDYIQRHSNLFPCLTNTH